MGLFGARADKVLTRGDALTGTIVAIEVSSTGGEHPTRIDEYVVAIGGQGRRLGVRQHLPPTEWVRLGMPVQVRVLKDDMFIDWAATMAAIGQRGTNDTDGWKPRKDHGRSGIVDENSGVEHAAKKGVPAHVRIDALGFRNHLGGIVRALTINASVVIEGDQPYEVALEKHDVPFYATHLATVGRVLSGYVAGRRLDRVTVDWARAAQDEPGVGLGPAEVFASAAPAAGSAMGMGGGDVAPSTPAPAPDFEPPPPINGVSWETYLAVTAAIERRGVKPKEWDAIAQEHGVSAGAWAKASQQWGMAMIRNRDLQLSYAAAMS
jgi:hypothetical protein